MVKASTDFVQVRFLPGLNFFFPNLILPVALYLLCTKVSLLRGSYLFLAKDSNATELAELSERRASVAEDSDERARNPAAAGGHGRAVGEATLAPRADG